jgi:3-oxoacyl-[acyl-carrier protein] reductase
LTESEILSNDFEVTMGKTVFITGASRGIGLATAQKFEKEGYSVIAPSRSEMDLMSTDSINEYFHKNDITADCVVNNAGINPLAFIEDIKDQDLIDTVNINLIAPVLITRALVRRMKERRYGRIVNIASIWGVVSKEKRTSYSITKNGIHGLTNTLAVELGGYGILVNTICPGFTNTELTKKNVPEEEARKLCENIPAGRFAEPEEIASAVYYFGSEQNTYITGQKIVVDGGFTIR